MSSFVPAAARVASAGDAVSPVSQTTSDASLVSSARGWPRGRAWSAARRLASHRLAQFAAIGGVLFAVAPAVERPDLVAIEQRTLSALAAADLSTRSAPGAMAPAASEADVRARFIEDEVLYREGLRLGLDRDDGIVRQRIVQKVLFMAEELGGASRPPTEAELRAFHTANAARFRRAARVHFRQVFARTREALPSASTAAWSPRAAGSPSPHEIEADFAEIETLLGPRFAGTVVTLPAGVWSAPVASAYGWHRVLVLGYSPARPATFEEARAEVAAQFVIGRREDAIARYLAAAFARYRIEIDGRPVSGLTPSRRLALRSVAAPED